nr:hypothetical protein Hi04_10k_c5548_00026 [uncultured bacterium]
MKASKCGIVLCWLVSMTIVLEAQVLVSPQVRTKPAADGKVTVVEVGPHFVSAIRLTEPVNSIAVGDPALFQVEHSEREPELVLVKALSERSSETNLLVSTIHGHQFSFLLVNRGGATSAKVDFLLQYKRAVGFLVEPEVVPFPMIGQTAPIEKSGSATSTANANVENGAQLLPTSLNLNGAEAKGVHAGTTLKQAASLDDLLRRQEAAPLPALYGERIEAENVKGDRLRVGVSEILDGGDQVTVLFSVVNTSKHAILLMPPQVQLGGKSRTGKLVKHDRWSTAEQLPVADFRLSRRRVGTGDRADGVVVFQRPPYKQSTEQLFLQMAESGAVDRPALAPIGFGVSSVRQEEDHGSRGTRN